MSSLLQEALDKSQDIRNHEAEEARESLIPRPRPGKTKRETFDIYKERFGVKTRLVMIFGIGFIIGIATMLAFFSREFDSSITLKQSALRSSEPTVASMIDKNKKYVQQSNLIKPAILPPRSKPMPIKLSPRNQTFNNSLIKPKPVKPSPKLLPKNITSILKPKPQPTKSRSEHVNTTLPVV